MLAGLPVQDADVLELARLLREVGFEDTAGRLEDAYDREAKVLALTIAEREQILRALDDPPDGLAELRGVLRRVSGVTASRSTVPHKCPKVTRPYLPHSAAACLARAAASKAPARRTP
jgi:hypothetical protein